MSSISNYTATFTFRSIRVFQVQLCELKKFDVSDKSTNTNEIRPLWIWLCGATYLGRHIESGHNQIVWIDFFLVIIYSCDEHNLFWGAILNVLKSILLGENIWDFFYVYVSQGMLLFVFLFLSFVFKCRLLRPIMSTNKSWHTIPSRLRENQVN